MARWCVVGRLGTLRQATVEMENVAVSHVLFTAGVVISYVIRATMCNDQNCSDCECTFLLESLVTFNVIG